MEFKPIVKSVTASFVSVTSSAIIYNLLLRMEFNSGISLIASIALAMLSYALLALIMGLIRKSDVAVMPFGSKIARILLKLKLIRE